MVSDCRDEALCQEKPSPENGRSSRAIATELIIEEQPARPEGRCKVHVADLLGAPVPDPLHLMGGDESLIAGSWCSRLTWCRCASCRVWHLLQRASILLLTSWSAICSAVAPGQ